MSFLQYVAQRWSTILDLGVEHVQVVLVAIAVAAGLGVGVSLLVYRSSAATAVALGITSSVLTIPSFAMFGLLIPFLGLGYRSTVVALVAYAMLPIMRNTVTGLRGVDPAAIKSARGMGMNAVQRMIQIELPTAWPVIITGIRVSTMMTVSIAAIAAYVNGPGLGRPIFAGLIRIGSVNAVDQVLSAIVAVVLIAFVLDAIFLLLGRVTTPRGIRD
jgi:osmoprotectant transport system permease protein